MTSLQQDFYKFIRQQIIEFNEDLESEFEYINNCIFDFRDKYKNELNFISKNMPLQVSSKVR